MGGGKGRVFEMLLVEVDQTNLNAALGVCVRGRCEAAPILRRRAENGG